MSYIHLWKNKKGIFILIFLVILVFILIFPFRLDLTSDKRYTLSPISKKLMQQLDDPLKATLYLEGDLNPGFLRMKKSTIQMLEELSAYSKKGIEIKTINPSLAKSSTEREENYLKLSSHGLTPTAVYERDKEGKAIQKIIFPWLEIEYEGNKTLVNLLKNLPGNSGEQNINISIENLEFEITDAIRRLTSTQVNKIAFLEGHGELSEAETYDISKALSRYFQIDRGIIGTDASILDDYKVLIVAKPMFPFSEKDKFIIDQYIMKGGRILWLIDGVQLLKENLSTVGFSPAWALDINLNDQLFRYGVRINPVLLQDVQCVLVPVNVASQNQSPHFEPMPWYFAPLLLTSYQHPITRNITEIKTDFCSSVDVVGDNPHTKSTVLLATSNNTHIIPTPSTIDLKALPKANDKEYFNLGYVPVAILVEGSFESVFRNRMLPAGLININEVQNQSKPTRQIFVADGDIIRNETSGLASDSTTLPLGFDRYMNQQFGNKDFIQNAVLYLADEEGWMQLRTKTFKLRLLNKNAVRDKKNICQVINISLPIILLALFGIIYQWIRKRKYSK